MEDGYFEIIENIDNMKNMFKSKKLKEDLQQLLDTMRNKELDNSTLLDTNKELLQELHKIFSDIIFDDVFMKRHLIFRC